MAASANEKNMRSVRLSIVKNENKATIEEQFLGKVTLSVPFWVSALENNDLASSGYCERMKKDLGNLKGAKFGLILSVKEDNKIYVEVKGLVRLLSVNAVLDYFVKEESKLDMKVVLSYKDLTMKPRVWKTIEVETTAMKICHSSGNRDNYLGLATVASAWRSDGRYQIKLESLKLTFEVLTCMENGDYVKPMGENVRGLPTQLEDNPLNYDLVLIAKNGCKVKCHSIFVMRNSDVLYVVCNGASYVNPLEVNLDMSENCLKSLLNFLYAFDLTEWKYVRYRPTVAMEIIKLAPKYEVWELGSLMLDMSIGEEAGWITYDGDMEMWEALHRFYDDLEYSSEVEQGRFCYLFPGNCKCREEEERKIAEENTQGQM